MQVSRSNPERNGGVLDDPVTPIRRENRGCAGAAPKLRSDDRYPRVGRSSTLPVTGSPAVNVTEYMREDGSVTVMGEIHIEIVDYDAEWPARFEREAARMREILGDHAISIEHVGSTSVPGLAAKPIVDICPVVSDMDEGQTCAELLHRADYYLSEKDRGEEWIELGRIADDGQEFNIHVRPRDSKAVAKYLLLREYLRDHPQARDEYAAIKRDAAEMHPNDITAYTRQKSDFIEHTVEKAREEGYEHEI